MTLPATQPSGDFYTLTKRVQRHIGFQRIRLGALLCVLEQTGEWQGRTSARSFRGFLREEGIEPNAARQYMTVARSFVLNLQIDKEELLKISHASMRVLCAAAAVANQNNLAELISIIATLPRPDAIAEINDRYPVQKDLNPAPGKSRPVGRILGAVSNLTMTDRAELYQCLGLNQGGHRAITR